MRSLRTQLLLSYLLLVLLMAVVMVVAVVNFWRLGRSVDRILRDNYKSVVAAQNMKEALERQDSAATFFLAGQADQARRQFEANRSRFEQAYQIEANNITESGEQHVADDLGRRFAHYRRDMKRLLYARPPLVPDRARSFYFGMLEPQFVGLKRRAQDVLDLNQNAILQADRRAKRQAERATWLSVGMTAGALALAVVLALRLIPSALTPLVSLARQAEEIGAGHLNQVVELRRDDEIGALASAFNGMAQKLRDARAALRERAERAERMSDAALANLYDPVLVTDARACIVHLNRAAEGLFGPDAGARGRPVGEVVNETRIAQAVERAIRHEHTSAEEGETAFVPFRVGEKERTYRLRATPITVGKNGGQSSNTVLGAVAVLEDVTYLREVDRLKTEFIGVASHELRTPVTSLLLSTDLLAEGAAGPLTPAQAEIIRAQQSDLQRLESLLRDLLDLTRLEAGATPPRFEVVAPGELVQAALAAVRAPAEAGGVRLERGGNVPSDDVGDMRVDRAQITRVLVNLLNNAVRHTPAGGTIRISVAPAPGDPAQLVFAVADTGSGIPAAYLPHLFERFVQVPGATRGGAGLGLSIAKTIVEAHGGAITVESEPGRGSTFTVMLRRGGAAAG